MPQAWRALQGQEDPQDLKETEVSLVSVELLEMLGQQVSDGEMWGWIQICCAHMEPPRPVPSPLPLLKSGLALLGRGKGLIQGRCTFRLWELSTCRGVQC